MYTLEQVFRGTIRWHNLIMAFPPPSRRAQGLNNSNSLVNGDAVGNHLHAGVCQGNPGGQPLHVSTEKNGPADGDPMPKKLTPKKDRVLSTTNGCKAKIVA